MGRAAEKDALMVLRALCRLSAQGGEARKDDLAMQGKAVALQLLKSLLGHISDYRYVHPGTSCCRELISNSALLAKDQPWVLLRVIWTLHCVLVNTGCAR